MTGELYKLRPAHSAFDKKQAKKVCIQMVHIVTCLLIYIFVFQKIRKWFYNHYSAPHRRVIKFTRKWSARNAFYHEQKADIMELAQEMSGGAPGSQAFLGALQDATTRLWKKVSIEEQERFAEIAQDWSENAPPKGIQAKSTICYYSVQHLTDPSP